MGNSKMLLGLGLGTIIGGVMGYLANTSKGKKVRRNVYGAARELEQNAEDMWSNAKNKAEKVGANIANKVSEKTDMAKDMAKDKAHEFTNSYK